MISKEEIGRVRELAKAALTVDKGFAGDKPWYAVAVMRDLATPLLAWADEIEEVRRQLADARAVLASLEYETNREQEKLMDDNQRLRAEKDKARTEALEARMALRDSAAKLAKAIELLELYLPPHLAGELSELKKQED